MAKQPKSDAVIEYRRQIAAYLEAVKLGKGWKNVRLGQEAGDISYTTIGRALKGEHTMGFPSLLALEAASDVPIPHSLRMAAINAQRPTRTRSAPSADELAAIAESLQTKSREDQQAFIEELQRRLAHAR